MGKCLNGDLRGNGAFLHRFGVPMHCLQIYPMVWNLCDVCFKKHLKLEHKQYKLQKTYGIETVSGTIALLKKTYRGFEINCYDITNKHLKGCNSDVFLLR